MSFGSCPPTYLRGAGKVAEMIGHQHHDVFWDPMDRESCIFHLSLAHTGNGVWWWVQAPAPTDRDGGGGGVTAEGGQSRQPRERSRGGVGAAARCVVFGVVVGRGSFEAAWGVRAAHMRLRCVAGCLSQRRGRRGRECGERRGDGVSIRCGRLRFVAHA
jgi:hypothetical protein